MTQEEKDLLLKDLCARLPYGVKYNYDGYIGCDYTMNQVDCNTVDCTFLIESVKPYLFPLSSMTAEQKKFFKDKPIFLDSYNELVVKDDFFGNSRFTMLDDWLGVINWCYENHFDIYGLIPMGLAIDATGKNIY